MATAEPVTFTVWIDGVRFEVDATEMTIAPSPITSTIGVTTPHAAVAELAGGGTIGVSSQAEWSVGDPTSGLHVFLKDTLTGTVELISQTSDGTAGNGTSLGGSMSADSRFVVFESSATNLTDRAT
ncbi:MAG: hypothetical protein SGJ11_02560 [Phycisphaerae bacterium]|nr:hypothetical protein [Phycisphaerae bacterium]